MDGDHYDHNDDDRPTDHSLTTYFPSPSLPFAFPSPSLRFPSNDDQREVLIFDLGFRAKH